MDMCGNGVYKGKAKGTSAKPKVGTMVTIDGALTGDSPCEKSGPPASVGQVEEGRRGPRPPRSAVPVPGHPGRARAADPAAGRRPARVAVKYPTVATAEAAGYRKSTVYVPCIGAHYTNTSRSSAKFDAVGAVGAALRRHQPRLEDRRPELPRVPPGRPAGRLRRSERHVAPAQLQRRPLHERAGRRGRQRVDVEGRVRGARRQEGRARRHLDGARLGRARAGSAAGACSPASARSSVAASAAPRSTSRTRRPSPRRSAGTKAKQQQERAPRPSSAQLRHARQLQSVR